MSKAQEKPDIPLYSIEALKQSENTCEHVFQGIKALNGWSTGKMLTRSEYTAAIHSYLTTPINKAVKTC